MDTLIVPAFNILMLELAVGENRSCIFDTGIDCEGVPCFSCANNRRNVTKDGVSLQYLEQADEVATLKIMGELYDVIEHYYPYVS